MYKIIIINGYPGSGKDTFVELFKEMFKVQVVNISSVDYIKNILIDKFGIKDFKDSEIRNVISTINKKSDYSLQYTIRQIRNFIEDSKHIDGNYCFIHMREPERIDVIKHLFGVKTLFIERKIDLDTKIKNGSDLNVEYYKYDIYVNNNGSIDDLKKHILSFYSLINK